MKYHIVYDKKNGEILHIHSVFDGSAGAFVRLSKKDVMTALSDFVPQPEEFDVLAVREALDLFGMHVNPASRKLEKYPSEQKEEV